MTVAFVTFLMIFIMAMLSVLFLSSVLSSREDAGTLGQALTEEGIGGLEAVVLPDILFFDT